MPLICALFSCCTVRRYGRVCFALRAARTACCCCWTFFLFEYWEQYKMKDKHLLNQKRLGMYRRLYDYVLAGRCYMPRYLPGG